MKKWSKDWQSKPGWTQHPIIIDELLYEYDGPVVFTSKFGSYTTILSRIDEDDDGEYYAAGTVSDDVLNALRQGNLSLRGALLREPCYVMCLDGLFVRKYWECKKEEFPLDLLPESGRTLIPEIKYAADVYEQLQSYFSVRFAGAGLAGGAMPFSTFKSLIDEVYEAARKIMMPDGLANSKSATFDFDLLEPAFGSLVVNLDRPKLHAGNIRKRLGRPDLEMGEVQENISQKRGGFFDEMGALVAEAEDGEIAFEQAKVHAALLEQVQGLLPSEETTFDQVDFRANVGAEQRQLVVTEEVGEVLKRAHAAVAGQPTELAGRITIINSKRCTFVIELPMGREVTCAVSSVLFEQLEQHVDFRGGTQVAVQGNKIRRPRRDYVSAEAVVFLPPPP